VKKNDIKNDKKKMIVKKKIKKIKKIKKRIKRKSLTIIKNQLNQKIIG